MQYSRQARALIDMYASVLHNMATCFEAEAEVECEYDTSAELFFVADMPVQVSAMMYVIGNGVEAQALFEYNDYKGPMRFEAWHKLYYIRSNN